jgi:hypothetical protein
MDESSTEDRDERIRGVVERTVRERRFDLEVRDQEGAMRLTAPSESNEAIPSSRSRPPPEQVVAPHDHSGERRSQNRRTCSACSLGRVSCGFDIEEWVRRGRAAQGLPSKIEARQPSDG